MVHPLVRRFAKEMQAQGITDRELAARTGYAGGTFSRWRNGVHSPPIDALADAFQALGFYLEVRQTNTRDMREALQWALKNLPPDKKEYMLSQWPNAFYSSDH